SEVDEKSWCVRVRSGELETGWLRWNTTRAGAFNVWLPPSPGEQVVIACIGGNPEFVVTPISQQFHALCRSRRNTHYR
ncbi:phage baseplate assembly protein V, partial [Escherichia coli]